MKKILTVLALFSVMEVSAQNISVPEPEFIHGYFHLTSDSTFKVFPKEQGEFKKHESKMSKFAKIGGKIANAAGSIGIGVAGVGAASGSLTAVTTGLQAASGAMGAANAVGTLNQLAGFEGMDIVFDGKTSNYTVTSGEPLRFIVREESNSVDPLEMMRIVRFKQGKKDRKIRWMNISSGLLGGYDAFKNGYLYFTGQKYGDSSYLITVPFEELEPGEYGVIVGNAAGATVIPVATFSVQ